MSSELFNIASSELQTEVLPGLEYLREKHNFPAGECGGTSLPEDIKDIVHAAPALLSSCPGFQKAELSFQNVQRLGLKKTEERKTDRKPQEAVLGMLAQLRRPFALRYASEKLESSFSIGMIPEFSAAAESLLRGAFGIASLKKADSLPDGKAEYACCESVRMDTASLQKALDDGQLASWLELATKTALSCRTSLTLTFTPIDDAWLGRQINEIYKTMDILARYEEHSLQFSGGTSSSREDGTNLAKGLREGFVKDAKNRVTPNLSASQSVKSTLSQLHSYIQQLEFRLAEMEQCKRDGGWSISICVQGEDFVGREMLKAALGSSMIQRGYSCRWQEKGCEAMILPAFRLAEVACFPMHKFAGVKLEELHEYELNPPECAEDEETFDLGRVIWNETILNRRVQFSAPAFNRHAFVCGKTGSGKSNTVCHLLSCLKNIPFMVIEPVKGEYRTLAKVIKNTKVFTMDAGSREQLPINPFWFPEGSSLQYHISCLMNIISSAFDLYAAMPNILKKCLNNVYTNLGWNLVTGRNSFIDDLPAERLYPTFDSLCAEVKVYLDNNFDEGELKNNYSNALLARLSSFTRGTTGVLLNQAVKTPLKEWDEGNCNVIIELDALNDEDKSIVMGALIAQYFQYIKYCRKSQAGEKLRHIFVLEEAHHLFAAENESSNGNNSRKHLVQILSNMLAEIRAYGEGFIIVDQSPGRISEEVLRNTNVKIVHNVDFGKDVKVLQDTLLLSEDDRFPSRLGIGQALVRCGGMDMPILTKVDRCDIKDTHIFTKDALSATSYTAATLLDNAMEEKLFMEKTKQLCRRFVNQVLYSDLWEIQKAYIETMNAFNTYLAEFGFLDRLAGIPYAEFYLPVLSSGISRCLMEDDRFRKQARLSKLVSFYVQRILELYTHSETGGISDEEWELLEEYRRQVIYQALARCNAYDTAYNSFKHLAQLRNVKYRLDIIKKLTDKIYDTEFNPCDVNVEDKDSVNEYLDFIENQVLSLNLFQVLPKSFCNQLALDIRDVFQHEKNQKQQEPSA